MNFFVFCTHFVCYFVERKCVEWFVYVFFWFFFSHSFLFLEFLFLSVYLLCLHGNNKTYFTKFEEKIQHAKCLLSFKCNKPLFFLTFFLFFGKNDKPKIKTDYQHNVLLSSYLLLAINVKAVHILRKGLRRRKIIVLLDRLSQFFFY